MEISFFFLALSILSGCNSKDIRQPQTRIVEIKELNFQPAELENPYNITEGCEDWVFPTLPN